MRLLLLCLIGFGVILASLCPRGYTYYPGVGLCYRIINTPLDWIVAQSTCAATGGLLATVPNVYANMYLLNLTQSFPGCSSDYWIGLNAFYSEIKDWNWLDGSSSSYRNWLPGKPEGKHGQWPVVRFIKNDGRWCDSQSDWSYCPICSAPPNTTNEACDSGWTYFAPTASCYRNFLSETLDHAESFCQLAGAHIASIHSTDENNLIIHMTNTGMNLPSNQQVWLGLTRIGSAWQNLDGTPVDYTPFSTGYPKASNGTNNCAILFADSDNNGNFFSQWQDTTCTQVQRAFVCKKPANS